MSFMHSSRDGRPKLPVPKERKKIFYSPRIEDSELNELLVFGIMHSLNCRSFELNSPDPDNFLNQAIIQMRDLGYCQGKILWIIRNKMNNVRLGVESGRIVRTVKTKKKK